MWTTDIETDIYSIVKAKVTTALSSTFPNLFFTLDDATQTEPKFPTVYIHFTSVEMARDFESNTIPAIRVLAQYEVVTSKAQGLSGARVVGDAVLEAFKSLRFEAISLPEFQNNAIPDTKRLVGRCQRVIGNGDTWN